MLLTTGILVHRDEKYLSRCLETLTQQEGLGTLGSDWQIVVRDNAAPDKAYILEAQQQFPDVVFLMDEDNAGYSRGHNDIMRRFPADFHAILNNDVLYEPNFLLLILKALEDQQYGSGAGKLLKWNFGEDPEKSNVIDTVGIAATKSHQFKDLGQGEEDHGQFDNDCKRFGASGAAVIYRRSDLERVKYEGDEFYDETMFMYKEDCDLSERLVAIGKPCIYVPEARAWHDRTASGVIKRSERSVRERSGSAAHQTVILKKHMKWLPFSIRLKAMLRDGVRWCFLMIREPMIFLKARKILRTGKAEMKKRREQTKHVVKFAEVANLFS
jgi:GT2 family glycosyltransferase